MTDDAVRRPEGRDARPDGDDPLDDPSLDGEAGIPQEMVRLLEVTADLEPPVEVSPGTGGVLYGLGGRAFAWAGGLTFEAQLGPDIGAAALRTPDVTPSPRGPGWIRLQPAHIDDHAADRVIAWFEMARRIAAGRQVRPDGGRRH
jgi:hypothetical protein